MSAAQGSQDTARRQLAWALGAAGLLPFFGNALFAWVVPPYEAAGVLRSQAHYAGAILGFLGALHWGVVLGTSRPFIARDGLRLVWSVIPALFGWIVTLYGIKTSLPLLCAALPLVLGVDLFLYRGSGVPRWFLGLRVVLTVVATLCVGACWLALATRMPPG